MLRVVSKYSDKSTTDFGLGLSGLGRKGYQALLLVMMTGGYAAPGLAQPSDIPSRDGFEERVEYIMSTDIVVIARADVIERLAPDIFNVFREVERTMNEWKGDSPLAQLNKVAGEKGWTELPQDLYDTLKRSVDIAEKTDGAFDPTWAALWGLWNFSAPEPQVPDKIAIQMRVAYVGYRGLKLHPKHPRARLATAGMAVGLGGIAKGVALDKAAKLIRDHGMNDVLISAGGQVIALGSRGGRAWRVGIRDPRGDPADSFAMVEAKDVSVSTSGDYERYFTVGGERYHHILDPKTGMPTQGLRSATVISADATLADALSTALMVKGPVDGLELLKRFPGVEAVMVDGKGQVTTTPKIAKTLVRIHPPTP